MNNTQHYTWYEARELMRKFNEEHQVHTKGVCNEYLVMVAVITEDSFNRPYTLEERSYKFTNDNKAFIENQCSYSVFANCLDGKDIGVRLDWYIPTEWKVEYCYVEGVYKNGEKQS